MTAHAEQPIRFVRLEESHVPQLLPIEKEAYPDPWSAGMFRDEYKNPRSYFYVAYAGETLMGYGGFWLVLDEAHVTSVTISREYRGRGYGRALTRFLLDKAVEEGARRATLEVRRSNKRAYKLYSTLGFREAGVRKGYYPKSGEDAIVMLCDLGVNEEPAAPGACDEQTRDA